MRHRALRPKGWLIGSTGALAVAALVATPLITTAASASATQASHSRPGQARAARPRASALVSRSGASTSIPVTAFTQEFQSNTAGFCPAGSGNAPCNGGVNNYGSISRAVSGFSNGGVGNYAPSTKALTGEFYAWTSGSQMDNRTGCPSTAVEYCTGPYALFGKGDDNTFPSNGFTVTDDLYLSPKTAKAGNLVDDDVAINDSSGQYGRDEVITTCSVTGGIAVSFGEASPGTCGTTPVITAAGWYRFVFIYYPDHGDVYLTMKVLTEPKAALVTEDTAVPVEFCSPTCATSAEPVSAVGGPFYFWLPTENVMGLPLANYALQLGQVPAGHTP